MADFYLSKAGVDTNNGLTPATAKLTIAGIKAVLIDGENTVYVGIGVYSEAVAFNVGPKYVTLIGDYSGSIFGSASGTIELITTNNYNLAYVRRIDRIQMTISGNNLSFISNLIASDVVFNYVDFKPTTGAATYLFASSADFRTRIVLNNCNLVASTGWIEFASGFTSYGSRGTITFNTCDFRTNNQVDMLYNMSTNMIFNNCSIKFKSNTLFSPSQHGRIRFNTCSIQIWNGGTVLVPFYTSGPSANHASEYFKVYFKNCSLVNSTSANIYLGTYNVASTATYWNFNSVQVYAEAVGGTRHQYRAVFVMDNINSNGTVRVFTAYGTTVDEVNTTYNSKQIMYVRTVGQSGGHPMIIFKLDGLNANTAYNINFDYMKVGTSQEVRVGILRYEQTAKEDLYTTPANAYTYADYTTAAHTANSWYAKTLTFTTRALASQNTGGDEYYLVMYPSDTYTSDYKITKPVIAKV